LLCYNIVMKKNSINPHLYRARVGNCLICGKEYRAVSDFGDRKQKYCSRECWSKSGRLVNKCLLCDSEIITYKSVNKKYCNRLCRDEHYKERFKGEASHFWEGGKTKESKLKKSCSAYKSWRMSVFKRDHFTCLWCGIKDNTIEADHIKPQSQYPELIYDVDNGRTLCHECHKKTDTYGCKHKSKKAILEETGENFD